MRGIHPGGRNPDPPGTPRDWGGSTPPDPPGLLRTSKLVKVYRADGVTVEAVRGVDLAVGLVDPQLVEHPRRAGARPAVHNLHPRGRVQRVEPRNRPRLFAFGIDPIDAAFIFAGANLDFLLGRFGNPLGVLDHEAIHIADPECAVRAGAAHAGTEPAIFRGQEFALLLVGGAVTGKRRPLRFHNLTMDQINERYEAFKMMSQFEVGG